MAAASRDATWFGMAAASRDATPATPMTAQPSTNTAQQAQQAHTTNTCCELSPMGVQILLSRCQRGVPPVAGCDVPCWWTATSCMPRVINHITPQLGGSARSWAATQQLSTPTSMSTTPTISTTTPHISQSATTTPSRPTMSTTTSCLPDGMHTLQTPSAARSGTATLGPL